MLTDRRRFWITLLFLCLLAPFAALLVINLTSPSARPAVPPTATTEAGMPSGPFAGFTGTPPARANAPLLAAGDGQQIWVVQPVIGDGGAPGFELFNRSADTEHWHLAMHNGDPVWSEPALPSAIVMEIPQPNLPGPGPFIFNQRGWVDSYSLDDAPSPRGLLPPGHAVVAAAGGVDQLFAVTLGAPFPGKVFDSLPAVFPSAEATKTVPPGTGPATAPASAPATAPAATSTAPEGLEAQSLPAPRKFFNAYWYPPSPTDVSATMPAKPRSGNWCILPALGDAADRAAVPADNAQVALTEYDGMLIVFWVDGTSRELVARTLDYRDSHAVWSNPIRSPLPEEINGTRLLPVRVGASFYLFWPVPTGDSVDLHGGRVELRPGQDACKLLARNMLPKPLALGKDAQGISVTDDVAVAPAENSLLVVFLTRNAARPRVSMLFDTRGHLLSGPDAVEPVPPAHESQVGPNIAMLVMALLLTLSLWQWRQRPAAVALPAGVAIAPLHLRAGALFIDLLLPYVVVQVIFGGFSNGPLSLISAWLDALSRPQELAQSVDLLVFIGLFLAHTTVGEYLFQKTIGKSLLSLRVVMMDGAKPGLGAVLVRNVLRLPELVLAVGPLYVLISDRRQRLGDLLARTLVVTTEAPEEEKKPAK